VTSNPDWNAPHKRRFYNVTCFEPPAGEGKYGRSWNLGIVCYSVVEAVAIVQRERPNYRIDGVSQSHIVHYVVPENGSER
jgi:hypothetical protein